LRPADDLLCGIGFEPAACPQRNHRNGARGNARPEERVEFRDLECIAEDFREIEEIAEQGVLYACIAVELVDGGESRQQQRTQIDSCFRNRREREDRGWGGGV
jgi:hypothetical protein